MGFSVSTARLRLQCFVRSLRLGTGRVFRFAKRQEGATAIEYALLLGTVVVAVAGGLTLFSGELNNFFNGVVDEFKNTTM